MREREKEERERTLSVHHACGVMGSLTQTILAVILSKYILDGREGGKRREGRSIHCAPVEMALMLVLEAERDGEMG